MENKKDVEEPKTVPFPLNKQIDPTVGALVLIRCLYQQGKINKATYDKVQKKYNKFKNKDSEVSDYEK